MHSPTQVSSQLCTEFIASTSFSAAPFILTHLSRIHSFSRNLWAACLSTPAPHSSSSSAIASNRAIIPSVECIRTLESHSAHRPSGWCGQFIRCGIVIKGKEPNQSLQRTTIVAWFAYVTQRLVASDLNCSAKITKHHETI